VFVDGTISPQYRFRVLDVGKICEQDVRKEKVIGLLIGQDL
jgi:hypothetical protein